MPERIAGKTFYSPDEIPEHLRPSAEALAEAEAKFAAYDAALKAARAAGGPPKYEPKTEANRRMWDDLNGTEYEDWTPADGTDDRPPRPRS